jgi:uncharacterized protein (DUF362 family)
MSAVGPAALKAAVVDETPNYKVVSAFGPSRNPGMPGPYKGQVVSVHAEKSIDTQTEQVDVPTVKEMMARGMKSLTGAKTVADAWRKFFTTSDVVGVKVNCSGSPNILASPAIVAEIVQNLMAIGLPASQIYLYERNARQLTAAHYERVVPEGVTIWAAEAQKGAINAYDPNTYVEVDFFGEQDTRSNLVRLVSDKFTKIINVPNMKDHGASGVTGCLKNIAYGNFSNVARSHRNAKTNTLTFIGTLANVEPVRSRTVLNIMDGLKGVWHGGPFSTMKQFRFFPKQMMFGTDPVAMDRLLLDIIDNKRKAENAMSVWNHNMANVKIGIRGYSPNANEDRYLREPGHIEYAAKTFGLGVYDIKKIKVKKIEI